MKLEGSLDAFSLPDIFQLLSFTKKDGGLHLASRAPGAANGAGGADGVVYFAAGQVTGASADGSRQPLARRLVGAGAVDDEALASAVERAASGEGVGVVRALLEAGALDADLLRHAVTDQAVDAVFDLLRWRDGDFAFVVDEANPDDVGVTLAVEQVLADAEGRKEGWETVSQVVPSPQAVLTMPVVLAADPVVSREEWSLLALVDGRRTVADLVDLTGSGQYAVVSTLAALVQRGLLEVSVPDTETTHTDHVAVVLRRQRLLAPLEGEAFTPVVDASHDLVQTGPEVPAAPELPAPVAAPDGTGDAVGPGGDGSAGTDAADHGEPALFWADAGTDASTMLGGAHMPGDVVPPRAEPFLPRRQAEFDESGPAPATQSVPVAAHQVSAAGVVGGHVVHGHGDVVGATAVAADPSSSVIERDPNVNRSLMLRLIAGVRGL